MMENLISNTQWYCLRVLNPDFWHNTTLKGTCTQMNVRRLRVWKIKQTRQKIQGGVTQVRNVTSHTCRKPVCTTVTQN
jgi:hypothetical protein